MPTQNLFAESPREVGLDPEKVEALFNRAEREVKDGLLPSTQIAIARNGKIGAMRTVGHAVQGGIEKPAHQRDPLHHLLVHQGDHVGRVVDSDRRRQAQAE